MLLISKQVCSRCCLGTLVDVETTIGYFFLLDFLDVDFLVVVAFVVLVVVVVAGFM